MHRNSYDRLGNHEISPVPNGCRVLLADDNLTCQQLARFILEHLGFEVRVASNGIEALDAFSQADYDLVFMDCQMPEMDGYQATRLMRQCETVLHCGKRHVPIIAVTGLTSAGNRERCFAVGMDDFLEKPFTLAGLYEIMERWLPNPHMDRSRQTVGSV